MAGRQGAVGLYLEAGPEEGWGAMPGVADPHPSQSLAKTAGNQAEGLSPGERDVNHKETSN